MTLPKWDTQWEKPDPLRGARGWCRHHYARVVVAVLLLVTAVGAISPVITRARTKTQVLQATHEQFRMSVSEAAAGPAP